MTQVFFFLSFPYNNANLEKSLRAELQKQNLSIVYCQNVFSNTDTLLSLYKHAQCRSFLVWENTMESGDSKKGSQTIHTKKPETERIPALSTFYQLQKWKGRFNEQRHLASLEKICLKYNGELLTAAITTRDAKTQTETTYMLSPNDLREFLDLSCEDFYTHRPLDENLQSPSFFLDVFQGRLLSLLDRKVG